MKVFCSILIIFFAYNLALACSCQRVETEEEKIEAINDASIIFYGKVVSVSSDDGKLKVKFKVSRSWKGLNKNEIIVTTASSSAACGVRFSVGELRTVYASDDPVSTSICWMMMVDEKLVRKQLGAGKSFETITRHKPKRKKS